jgi:hypothetical protein
MLRRDRLKSYFVVLLSFKMCAVAFENLTSLRMNETEAVPLATRHPEPGAAFATASAGEAVARDPFEAQ